jgi:hypothetical protein
LDGSQGKGVSQIDAVTIAPLLPFKISNIQSQKMLKWLALTPDSPFYRSQ